MQCAPLFFPSSFILPFFLTLHLISALLFNILHCVLCYFMQEWKIHTHTQQTHSNSNNQFINCRMEIHFRSWNISWWNNTFHLIPGNKLFTTCLWTFPLEWWRTKHSELECLYVKRCSLHLMSFFWKFPCGFSFIFRFNSMLHGKFLNKVFAINVNFLLWFFNPNKRVEGKVLERRLK